MAAPTAAPPLPAKKQKQMGRGGGKGEVEDCKRKKLKNCTEFRNKRIPESGKSCNCEPPAALVAWRFTTWGFITINASLPPPRPLQPGASFTTGDSFHKALQKNPEWRRWWRRHRKWKKWNLQPTKESQNGKRTNNNKRKEEKESR